MVASFLSPHEVGGRGFAPANPQGGWSAAIRPLGRAVGQTLAVATLF